MADAPDQPLWTPSPERVRASRMHWFMQRAAKRTGQPIDDYDALWRWSCNDPSAFWALVWEMIDAIGDRGDGPVLDDPERLPGAEWFGGARINFAEHLLRFTGDEDAIVFRGEHEAESTAISRDELRRRVAELAAALREMGVGPGDRVAGFMPNLPGTVIAMLAATSVGAIWSSCSPDFGVKGVLDRFARIEPAVLFTADGYSYGGKKFDSREKVAGILEGLADPPQVIVVPYLEPRADLSVLPGARHLADVVEPHAGAELAFERLPFDHPLYIMYSSGTTGLPKCIVQSAGGILLNQLKEHLLHVDLHEGERIFYFTTCGWMMWNWLVAALGTGATIVLFDGSPFHPDASALPRLAEAERIDVFGSSAKYFAALEKAGVTPQQSFDLSRLRSILSTGSPLAEESFDWLYRAFKSDVQVASISGGTDLNGCFVGGNPMLPVYRGEIQCRFLGMDVHAWNEDGKPVVGETGELVCTSAFPSMPIKFWGDEDGAKYQAAYFDRFDGTWCHGDFISINKRGGVHIFGRSDATLNPGGVRMGTAEIYRQVEPLEEIADCLVVGQEWDGDQRVILFVVMAEGHELSPELERRIAKLIRRECSPRHVPAKIIAVPDVPYTISMKKVELAVRDVIHGRPVKNRDALRNPEALDHFVDVAALQD
ncbi:MAG: acetoacetate--CoA ligase [Phycisphaerales bacterium]